MPLAGRLADLQTAMGQARLSVRIRNMLGVEEDPNIKVGINGFGRLGRMLACALHEADGIDLVAINDPFVDAEYMAYMLEHDSAPNGFRGTAKGDANNGVLLLDGRPVTVFSCKDPATIEWFSTGALYVIEASGHFTSGASAAGHREGGTQHIIMAAPCTDCVELVAGVNHERYAGEAIVSAGSPCTQCLAYLLMVLEGACEIAHASVNVLQACSAVELEHVSPGPSGAQSSDWRSSMQGSVDIIPTAVSAISSVRQILPKLASRLGGAGFRVPAATRPGASCVDMTLLLRGPTGLSHIRSAMRAAASEQPLCGRLGYRDDDVSAADFADDSRSVIFDAHASMQQGAHLVKLIAWYPHEWAYCRRIVELLYHMQAVDYGAPGAAAPAAESEEPTGDAI